MTTAAGSTALDLHLFARAHDGVFRGADAARAGWDHSTLQRRLADGRIERLHEGIYRFRSTPDSWRSRAVAAVWAGGDVAALSHTSAAHLFGLPTQRLDPLEIVCRRWERARHDSLTVHEFSGLELGDITQRAGLAVVVPELAVLQIAGRRWSTVDSVEAAIYAARRRDLVTNASLQEYLYRRARRGRPGVRKLRAALEQAAGHLRPTESDMETLLVQTLRRHGFPEPALQYELRDRDGRFIARVDAALVDWKILLEYDSDQEHRDVVDLARDTRRRLWAAQYGYWMLSVRAADLRDGGRLLAAALRGARSQLNPRTGVADARLARISDAG